VCLTGLKADVSELAWDHCKSGFIHGLSEETGISHVIEICPQVFVVHLLSAVHVMASLPKLYMPYMSQHNFNMYYSLTQYPNHYFRSQGLTSMLYEFRNSLTDDSDKSILLECSQRLCSF